MDAPFKSPRIGDDVTQEDRNRASFHASQIHQQAQRENRELTEQERMTLNGNCNAGVLDWSEAYPHR